MKNAFSSNPITHFLYEVTLTDENGISHTTSTYLKEPPYFGEDLEIFIDRFVRWYEELEGVLIVRFRRLY